MKYLILDLETTGKKTFKRFCNPLDPRHHITVVGLKEQGEPVNLISNGFYTEGVPADDVFSSINLDEIDVIVGQNFKFDMLWFWKNKQFQDWLLREDTMIWDTALTEYLLQGQLSASHGKYHLDALAKKYGGTVKDDRMKEFFKEGMLFNEIDTDISLPYAENDVKNTELVYLGQLDKVNESDMLNLVKVYSQHLLAITEIEFNGLYVDREKAGKELVVLEKDLKKWKNDLICAVQNYFPDGVQFNPLSSDHISLLLFGGIVKIKKDVKIRENGEKVYYKTGIKKGNIKTRKEIVDVQMKGFKIKPKEEWAKKNGKYKTDDSILKKFFHEYGEEITLTVSSVCQIRRMNKLISTYYYKEDGKTVKGLLSLVHPHTGCIHSEFGTYFTATGRLKSANPNVQNLHPEGLGIFTSRFEKGFLIEFDFSQLEVCLAAQLSKDKLLIKELNDGVDVHLENATFLYNKPVVEITSEERKKTKALTFGLIYGQHFKGMAKIHDLSEMETERFVTNFYKKYTGLKRWHKNLINQVKSTAKKSNSKLKVFDKLKGEFIRDKSLFARRIETEDNSHFSYMYFKSGKRYLFESSAIKTRGGVKEYWKQPPIKNYPVQGLAADLVAMQIGELFKFAALHRDKFLMINEVHDAILIDCAHEAYLPGLIKSISCLLETVEDNFIRVFKEELLVPIKVDYNCGKNWKELKAGE